MSLTRVLRPADTSAEARIRSLEARIRVLETAPGFAAGTSKGGTTRWQDLNSADQVVIGKLDDASYGVQTVKQVALSVSTGTALTLSGLLTANAATLAALLTADAATLAHALTSDSAVIGAAGLGSSGLNVGPSGTLLTQLRVYLPSLTPVALAASVGGQEQSFTVTGLATTDTVAVNPPGQTQNCPLVAARVSALNTLMLTFANMTAAANVPTSGTYRILAIRS